MLLERYANTGVVFDKSLNSIASTTTSTSWIKLDLPHEIWAVKVTFVSSLNGLTIPREERIVLSLLSQVILISPIVVFKPFGKSILSLIRLGTKSCKISSKIVHLARNVISLVTGVLKS